MDYQSLPKVYSVRTSHGNIRDSDWDALVRVRGTTRKASRAQLENCLVGEERGACGKVRRRDVARIRDASANGCRPFLTPDRGQVPLDLLDQTVRFERLDQVIDDTRFHCSHYLLTVRLASHHDYGGSSPGPP